MRSAAVVRRKGEHAGERLGEQQSICGTWRSLVAHLLWEQGVAGSNPAVPTEGSARGGAHIAGPPTRAIPERDAKGAVRPRPAASGAPASGAGRCARRSTRGGVAARWNTTSP